MDHMNEMKQQTDDASKECASLWDAICSRKVKNVSAKLTPLVTSAILLAGDTDAWIDNLGGIGQWK
jgi:hypothetical protein